MKEFIGKYEDRIHGVLSCFDCVIFRGYLPIMSGWAMAEFLYRLNQNHSSLRPVLTAKLRTREESCHGDGQTIWTTISIPHIQHRQGCGGATTGAARWNPARPGLYLLHSGTLSYFFVCVQQAGSGSAAVRSIGKAKMFTPLFLLHGSSFRFSPCADSNLVSHADPNLLKWP